MDPEPVFEFHCWKCGRRWTGPEPYENQAACPRCGRHGRITMKRIRDARRIV